MCVSKKASLNGLAGSNKLPRKLSFFLNLKCPRQVMAEDTAFPISG